MFRLGAPRLGLLVAAVAATVTLLTAALPNAQAQDAAKILKAMTGAI